MIANGTTHSVMFHHFHRGMHLPAQGSLSPVDFHEMIDWLSLKYQIRGANDYIEKFFSGALRGKDICLSFDDVLKCQYDIALPILNKRKISAFFFVYSSAFTDNPDYLEIFRYFRTSAFDSVDGFYEGFFENVKNENETRYFDERNKYSSLNYLANCPFYTDNDKWFRYLRDDYLGDLRYKEIMYELMSLENFDVATAKKNLWMKEEDLKEIYRQGHVIGLHSFSHPTRMSELPHDRQLSEYQKNLTHLEGVLGSNVIESMSHPCGDYNEDTLEILNEMGIRIGFRSNMGIKGIKSPLEIPREDHANVYRKMQR